MHSDSSKQQPHRFFPGDLVTVRPLDEILATLDEQGTLDKLPFMPEMRTFCGRQFRVSRRAFRQMMVFSNIPFEIALPTI